MQSPEWREYLNIPTASDEDIRQMESQLGIPFPEEFKQVLKLAQGKASIPSLIESEEVCKVVFGSIFHVLPEVRPSYSIKSMKDIWDEYYPYLLPIADSGGGCFFAYDLRKGIENPPVVFINAEGDPDDENESIFFVASSLTGLLSSLKDQPIKPFSVEALIESINNHPFRGEVITLESALSLPTLSIKNSETYFEFFFYPIGGPRGNRQIWPPYYRVISPASDLENIEYQPIEPNELEQSISSDEPLGLEVIDDQPRSEYEAQLKTLYDLAEQLIDIYPKAIEIQSEEDRQVISNFSQHFRQLEQQSLLPAHKSLNPEFFQWLEKTYY
jgi:SMI1 / KNR4 family (SUKH-1)